MISKEYFSRAASDIGLHGDNDMLPFDLDTKFIKARAEELSEIASAYCGQLLADSEKNNKRKIRALSIHSERLLAPAGHSGFRISTKIHPFWTVYFNGLGVFLAEKLEPSRFENVHSYRFISQQGGELFDRSRSWKQFRQCSAESAIESGEDAIVVQTDISSFYEHVSHHYLENQISDILNGDTRIGSQIVALLSKFSADRSFGLPVGGQCSRILAELFLNSIDSTLNSHGIRWYRFVDDYVLISGASGGAYNALAVLSECLATYGLTINKSKTFILSAKHYAEYVANQTGDSDDDEGRLREIDLHFDPYSDNPAVDYDSLKYTVESIDIQKLLNRETEKSIPDTFLMAQIGRTLRLQEPEIAEQLITTLLNRRNLHSFRASWSTIMRGISAIRDSEDFVRIHAHIDQLLDLVPTHSPHLLRAHTSQLHYLRTIRFAKTTARSIYITQTFNSTHSDSIKKACIDCWRHWKDREAFTTLQAKWNELSPNCQRMLWLSADVFGDQGEGFKRSRTANTEMSWALGIERQQSPAFAALYRKWCDDQAATT
jgi:hypothetical protein